MKEGLQYQQILRRFFVSMLLPSACTLMVVSSAAFSQSQPSSAWPLSTILDVEGEEKAQVVLSLVITLLKLRYPSSEDVSYEQIDERKNFVFVSGKDAIVDGSVNIDLFSFLSDAFREKLAGERSNSELCYVSSYPFEGGGWMTISVFNDKNPEGIGEDIYRCLTISLAKHLTGDHTDIDPERWREGFTALLTPTDF